MQRRDFLRGVSITAAGVIASPSISFAAGNKPKGSNALSYKEALAAVTGSKTPEVSDKVVLKVPEIAENGAVVPVTVEVNYPMNENDYVKAIHIFAKKNGNSRCADAHLSPLNGKAMLSTRIKLGETQEVVALAELSNGTFLLASQSVKVTIGGCG